MTKEEIREGIGRRIVDVFCDGIAYATEKRDGGKAKFTPPEQAKEFINYLHSQGVVITVEREFPTCGIAEVLTGNKQAIGCPYFNGGYVAFEPLI